MTEKQKTKQQPKPFLKGEIFDENTVKNVLRFAGTFLMLVVVSFIVCSMTGFRITFLRIAVNAAVIGICLFLFYNTGINKGTEAVARGEILYQRKEKGLEVTDGERRISYHPAKGLVTGCLGIVPFFAIACILAVTAEKQITGIGVLPSWMNTYVKRGEIGAALTQYTDPVGMSFQDIIRMLIRICLMPVINIIGAENKDGLLIAEKLSPLLMLIPAGVYGFGYLRGTTVRQKIHEEIAANNQKRIRREKKERKLKLKAANTPKGPQALN